MARFYGTLRGSRGLASRLGAASSGLHTVAASWNGAVRVDLYVNDKDMDCCRVQLIPWQGVGIDKLLYDGPTSGKPRRGRGVKPVTAR